MQRHVTVMFGTKGGATLTTDTKRLDHAFGLEEGIILGVPDTPMSCICKPEF